MLSHLTWQIFLSSIYLLVTGTCKLIISRFAQSIFPLCTWLHYFICCFFNNILDDLHYKTITSNRDSTLNTAKFKRPISLKVVAPARKAKRDERRRESEEEEMCARRENRQPWQSCFRLGEWNCPGNRWLLISVWRSISQVHRLRDLPFEESTAPPITGSPCVRGSRFFP